jgi:uncharacterized protein YbjT (DUF2867 family)
MSNANILVTGCGGVLGRRVREALHARGVKVRGLGRGPNPFGANADWARVDLRRSEGLASALNGIDAVVHCASNPRLPSDDLVAIGNLLAAMARARTSRLVFAGIAGIDRAAAFAYYGVKREVERRIEASGAPFVIARATQFHDFVDFILRRLDARIAVVVPSGARLQSVAVDFVAEALARHALGDAWGRAPDIHGPESLSFADLARAWLEAQCRRAPSLSLPMPFQPFRALRELEPVRGECGGSTWRQWLDDDARGDNAYQSRLG